MKTSVFADGIYFGEGPRWHEDRFWFSDFYAHAVKSVGLGGEVRTELALDGPSSGLGWLPDGRLLLVSMIERKILRREMDGSIVTHADLTGIAVHRANDMVVDRLGRAYVGSFGFDLDHFIKTLGMDALLDEPGPIPSSLAFVDIDGRARAVANGIRFPNGAVLTADQTGLILAETLGFQLLRFDVRPDGSLTKRRVFARLDGVAPDGICIDAEGAVWVANALAPEAILVAEGGERIAPGRDQPECLCRGTGRPGRAASAGLHRADLARRGRCGSSTRTAGNHRALSVQTAQPPHQVDADRPNHCR
jgi:sugar lactone lactonase YvrE